MVTLTEVEDEHFQHASAADLEEDDFTDTGMLSSALHDAILSITPWS